MHLDTSKPFVQSDSSAGDDSEDSEDSEGSEWCGFLHSVKIYIAG